MATLGNANHASQQNTSRLSYISTAPFDQYFYTYTTRVDTTNKKTIASLTLVSEATCEKCPAGRILRENGRKLYPGVNPEVPYYMVGVYDSVTFLSGYIYPNTNIFAVYNSDRPTYLEDDGPIPSVIPDYQATPNYGPAVLTSGNIMSSDGFVGVQSTIATGATYAGTYLYKGPFVTPPHPPFPAEPPFEFPYPYPNLITETPLVETGIDFPNECSNGLTAPFPYATLYPDGTIQSITYETTFDQPSTVILRADGNTFNTGNTSTLGSVHVLGNIATSGTLSYHTGLRCPDPFLVGASTLQGGTDGYSRVTVNDCGATPSSIILLTSLGSSDGNRGSILSAEGPTTGAFTIVSNNQNDRNLVQYFIVN